MAQRQRRIGGIGLRDRLEGEDVVADGVEEGGAVDLVGERLDVIEILDRVGDAAERGGLCHQPGSIEAAEPLLRLGGRTVGMAQRVEVARQVEVRREQRGQVSGHAPCTSVCAPKLPEPEKPESFTFSPSIT